MIYLFVMLLSATTPDGNGWQDGRYSLTGAQYKTIAACENARRESIRTAKRGPTTTLISNCATDEDVVEYRGFSQPEPVSKGKGDA